MSTDATLLFLPWLRKGAAQSIEDADPLSGSLPANATVEPWIEVDGAHIAQTATLRGPGHVIGLASAQLLRQEPKDATRDFESNYFPFVEFTSPELPWRYTPAAAGSQGQLRPWVVLVVIKVQAGVSITQSASGPLSVLTLESPAQATQELPDLADSAAWAHVQSAVELAEIEGALDTPGAVIARLMCPRRLEGRTEYLACLVPAFDIGRMAGLGEDTSTESAAGPAWDVDDPALDAAPLRLPVYASWTFATDADGDFEALARRLGPDESAVVVGLHDMDATQPSSLFSEWGGDDVTRDFIGALKSPGATQRFWPPTHRAWFQGELRPLLNAGAQRSDVPATAPAGYDPETDDPLVAPPLYGAWQASRFTVPPDGSTSDTWLRHLNLHPEDRAVAGLGAQVVRENQEALMASAWAQAADARQTQRLLNRGRLSAEIGRSLARRVSALDEASTLQVTAPLHSFIRKSATSGTLRAQLRTSEIPRGLVSRSFQRLTRPGTPMSKAWSLNVSGAPLSRLAQDTTLTFLAATADEAPADLKLSLTYATYPMPIGAQIYDPTLEPAISVEDASARMTITSPRGSLSLALPRLKRGREGSEETLSPLLKAAGFTDLPEGIAESPARLLAASAALSASRAVPAPSAKASSSGPIVPVVGATAIDLSQAAATVLGGLDPLPSVRAGLELRIPGLTALFGESGLGDGELPTRIDVAPVFEDPLFWDLQALGSEFVLPGAGEIPNNSVKLVEVSNAFVAAFLVGANHEMSREFLWREFPTSLGNTFFHRFWDTMGAPEADIEDIDTWSDDGLAENVTGLTADADSVAVAVIKGDLIRRYPTARFYIVKAEWDGDDLEPDFNQTEEAIFFGDLASNMVFYGFPRGVEEMRGDRTSGVHTSESAGWFVVIEEQPSEPRFGLDLPAEDGSDLTSGATTWSDLTWAHLAESEETLAGLGFAAASAALPSRTSATLDGLTWGYNSAHMASITYQKPFRLLLHADQLLEEA